MTDKLLLAPEKKFIAQQVGTFEDSVVHAATCQFDQLLTGKSQDSAWRKLNTLHRVFVVLSKELTTSMDALSKIQTLVDSWISLQGSSEDSQSSQTTQKELLLVGLHLMTSLFLKENWTGKSFLFVNAEIWYQEERVMKSDPSLIAEYNSRMANITFAELTDELKKFCEGLGVTEKSFNEANFGLYRDEAFMKNYNPSVFQEYMVINGEDCYRTLKLVNYYIMVKKAVEIMINQGFGDEFNYLHLLKARLAFLHAQVMSSPTETLLTQIVENYEKLFRKLESNPNEIEKETLALLYIEYGQALLHFYKYNECDEYLEKAKKLLGIEFSFTGKLGVRTKYQDFKVAQLTLEVEKDTTLGDYSKLDDAEVMEDNQLNLPKIIKLDDIIDNILYERPMIDHEDGKRDLSVYDHILVIGLIRYIQRTSPMDDLQREQVLAYIHQTEGKVKNWSVLVMTLLVKCLTEFGFLKKRERSLQQLHQIVDEWNVGKEDAYERQKYLFPLNFPSFIEFQLIIIEKYLSMGMTMTACQTYEQLGMLEECVECYFRAGHLDRSKELAQKLLAEKPTPKLYCVLGDIGKDPSMYEKAWEISGQKHARAQRSLGKHYFNQKDFAKAEQHLRLALELNDYHMDSWNLLGLICMNTNKLNEAIVAYSRVVKIDSGQAFCWANLASLFMRIDKYAEAMSTIEQAVKLNDTRWKLWQSYASIAYANKKFSKFVRAILKIIDLDQAQTIDDGTIKGLVVAINCAIESFKETPEEVRACELIYKDIKACFERLANKTPNRSIVWRYFSDFTHFEFMFYSLKKAVRDLDPDKTRVFMIDEPVQSTEDYKKAMLLKRFDLTLKECHTGMKVGWEADVEANKLVYDVTLRLIEHSRELKDPGVDTRLEIHLKAIKQILQECIGDKVDLSRLTLQANK